jgi:folate-binding protein YgfZ
MPVSSHSPTSTLLKLSGRDALGVLHRIATQQLDDLQPGQARMTCFCDFRGRLLYRACVAVDREQFVWLLRDDEPGESLATFIDHHVFREDVKIEDRSATSSVGLLLNSEGQSEAPGSLEDVTPTWTGEMKSGNVVPASAGARYRIGDPGTSAATDEATRIRSGWPRHDHEIEESFTPFEIGLAHEVHLSKGCFTGQEALMRLMTYRSVRRRLVRVHGHGTTPVVPADLIHGGETVGRLTSAAKDGDRWIGLAVVRHGEIGATALTVQGAAIDVVEPLLAVHPLGLPA